MAWTDEEIITGLKEISLREKDDLVSCLRFLIELKKRELFLLEGASSLRDYMQRFLGYGKSTADKRVWVAEAAAK
jgi:hypothetical protein